MINLYFTVWISESGSICEYSVDCEPAKDPKTGRISWGVCSRKKDLDEIVDYVVPEMVKNEMNGIEWDVKPYEGKFEKKRFDNMIMYTEKPSSELVEELKKKVKLAIEKYRAREVQE